VSGIFSVISNRVLFGGGYVCNQAMSGMIYDHLIQYRDNLISFWWFCEFDFKSSL